MSYIEELFRQLVRKPVSNRDLASLVLHSHRIIMTSQAELAQKIDAITAQLSKASTELSNEIAKLTAAVADAGTTSPEVDASLQHLQVIAQALDDMNPDAPAVADPTPAPVAADPSTPADPTTSPV